MIELQTCGTPYERGLAQGTFAKYLAMPYLEDLISRFDRLYSPDEQKKLILPEIEVFKKLHPRGYEEIQGLCKGLGMDEETYFRASLSSRFISKPKKCTTFGFLSQKGMPLIGKTDDIYFDELGMNILERVIPEKGLKYTHLHFAGTIWTTSGMNESGLAIAMTGIPGGLHDTEGLSSLDALSTILPVCTDVKEAVEHIKRLKVGFYGFSLMLGDPSGEIRLIEKNSNGTFEIGSTEYGFLLHTNTIISPELSEKSFKTSASIAGNSEKRYISGMELGRKVSKDHAGVVSFITEKEKYNIFQQGDHGLYTDYAVVLDPSCKGMTIFVQGRNGSVERYYERI